MKTINKNGYKINVNENIKDYFWKIYADHSWEPETFNIFDRYIHRGSTYLDIGAWIGPTVLYGAQKAKKVVALEPDKQAFGYLEENVSLNKNICGKITLLNAALTVKPGSTTLYTADANSSSSVINANNYSESYPVMGIPIQELYEKYDLLNTGFIKIDIESYEYQLMPHITKYLHKTSKGKLPTIYLSLHRPFLRKGLAEGYSAHFPQKIAEILTNVAIKRKSMKLQRCLDDYTYIYDVEGIIVKDRSLIFSEEDFTSVVATNEKW